jgi:4-alpha-glucanotransferase
VRRRAVISFLADERSPHDAEATTVLRALLRYLARSDAAVMLVNLEDLWGEAQPQNVPGTTPDERPNWSRKTRLPFETFASAREVVDALSAVARLRNGSEEA